MRGASATRLLSVLGSSRSNGLKRCKLNILFYCFSQKIQNPDLFTSTFCLHAETDEIV